MSTKKSFVVKKKDKVPVKAGGTSSAKLAMSTEQRYVMTFDTAAAEKQLEEMHARIKTWGVRSIVWYAYKLARLGLSGLNVEENSMKRVKDLISENNHVVLMPIYKSYADFFLLSYVLYHYGIELPFTFGNLGDMPPGTLFSKWMGDAGYIRSLRKSSQTLQSNFVNSALLKEIVENSRLTTVF